MGAVPDMSTSSWKSRFGSRRSSKDNSLQSSEDEVMEAQESSPSRKRNHKKGMRGRFSRLLPSNPSQQKLTTSSRDPSPDVRESSQGESPETKSSSSSEQVAEARTNREPSTVRLNVESLL